MRGRARARREATVPGLPPGDVRGAGAMGLPAALRLTGIGFLLILAFYLWIYPVRGFRLALGSDTPVYVWWARRTGTLGFRALLAGPRPGTIGPLAALSGALHVRVGTVIAVLQPVLAASVALSAAALVDVCLGHDRLRFALVALLTGGYLSLLVPGYLSTLAFGSAFLAGLTVVAAGSNGRADGTRTGPTMVAAVLLLGAAGLAHPLFLGLGAAILGGAFIGLVWAERRREWSTLRRAVLRPNPVRLGAAAAGGAALTLAGLAYIGRAARRPVQTSRDSLLRTVHLGQLSRVSYEHVLARSFPWYRVLTVVAFAALALLVLRRSRRDGRPRRAGSGDGPGRAPVRAGPRRALLWGALAAWLALTAGGVVALFAGTSAPGQRMAAFCLALPMLGAIGLAGGAGLYLFVAGIFWARSQPLIASPTSLQLRAAGAALAAEPPGTPLVLVADDRSAHAGFSIPRNLNYLRDAAPTGRIQDVTLFVGSPSQLLRGSPSSTGVPEHDRIAQLFLNDLRTQVARSPTPLGVVLQALDPEGYASLFHLPEVERHPAAFQIAPGVMTVPRDHGTAPIDQVVAAALHYPSDSGVARFAPWTPALLGPTVFLLVAFAGWPWTRLALPRHDALLSVALGPAFGVAAIALFAMAVDAAGLRLASSGGAVTIAVTIGCGFALLAARRASSRSREAPAPTT